MWLNCLCADFARLSHHQFLLVLTSPGPISCIVQRLMELDYRAAIENPSSLPAYQLTSGWFAMLDDGVGFSLVPWRPVIEKRLGQQVSAVAGSHHESCAPHES